MAKILETEKKEENSGAEFELMEPNGKKDWKSLQ